jgi:outer membrane lipoprotein SlyB
MKRWLAAILTAAMAALSTLPVASDVRAQTSAAAVAAPRISGFDVRPVPQPAPGTELLFTVYGSPGGSARVQIAGAGSIALDETDPGVYEGAYTIRQRDRITPATTATVNLRLGNRVASSVLDEPLIAAAGTPRTAGPSTTAATPGAPVIERFDVAPANRLEPGADLFFTVHGTPGGSATVRIAGVNGKLVLDEVKRGVYEGSYDIRPRDRIADDAPVTAHLRLGGQETTRTLDRSLVATGARAASTTTRNAESCFNCGVIEAINPVEVKGSGSYVGKIAGGVVGALLGSQIGDGGGRTAAQIAGAVGGAVAGNEIEKRVKKSTHYEVVVRLANGGTQTVSYDKAPPFTVGQRVRVENGALRGA